MQDIQAALDSIQQPALAADRHGTVLTANDAGRALLTAWPAPGLDAAWRQGLGASGVAGWQLGIATPRAFTDRLAPAADAAWRYRAAPVLDDEHGARWLVTLQRQAVDDARSQDLVQLGLSAALRVGRMGLWEWSPATGDSLWSPELYDVLRLPRGSGIEPGARFLQMVHPDDLPLIDAAVTGAQAKGGIDPFMFRVTVGDGSMRWIMTCALARAEPGQPMSRLVGVNFDVTDTVEASRHLADARRDRERQERIVEAVMAHAPVGIAVALRGEAEMAYVSRFGADMLGHPRPNERAWEAWQTYHVDGKTPAERHEMALSRAMAGEVIRGEEWFIRTSDDRLVPVSCNAGPICDADGQVIGGTVVWYDVSPFKEMQRQRELFLAAVSHELRTPLNAIGSWAQALSRPASTPDLLSRASPAIWRNVQTAARLLEDLLDLSRMSAGHLSLNLAEADLTEILHAAIDTVEPLADAAQVTLRLAGVPDAPVPLRADGLRLQQAVCNLLTNAVKFSPAGTSVEVRLQTEVPMAELTVTDQGAGIARAHLERVFEHFWQADGHSSRGLGLGLAIARHIVSGHGGTLTADSPGPDRGATFRLRLPLDGA